MRFLLTILIVGIFLYWKLYEKSKEINKFDKNIPKEDKKEKEKTKEKTKPDLYYSKKQIYDLSQLEIFARTVYGEARGESEKGQRFVAWVIKNRIKSNSYHDTYKEVCFKEDQFAVWDGVTENKSLSEMSKNEKEVLKINLNKNKSYRDIKKLCKEIMNKQMYKCPIPGVTNFVTQNWYNSKSGWWRHMEIFKKEGNHYFLS